MLAMDRCNSPAGIAAASASCEYHVKKTRSQIYIIEIDPELMINGIDTFRNSATVPRSVLLNADSEAVASGVDSM